MNSYSKKSIHNDSQKLLAWYADEKRDLPWRKKKDGYSIWVSEVMLQQTTVQAVIPYYNKFMKTFPKVEDLAKAPLEKVYEHWAGLGYYSRARSLHKAAQALVELGSFPENHKDLLQLPGIGDYTARAVASIAFGESVGVVDGNVIRVLSRRWNKDWAWWKTAEKREIQQLADTYVQGFESASINQSLMELGATICRPKSPTCFLCPWSKKCLARKEDTILSRPQKKARKALEIWHWQPDIIFKNKKVALIKNDYAPFLKGAWILPGKIKQTQSKPKGFAFQHGITHHKIFVSLAGKKSNFQGKEPQEILWLSPKQLKQKVPYALVQKAIALGLFPEQ